MANQLQLAEAQILGFRFGKQGFNLSELIESMGLTKSEWKKMKTQGMCNYLPEHMVEEIETTLNIKK